MSALFICFRDIFLTDEYEIVCRLHTKKTPQVDAARGQLFKLHMFENVLNSPGYVGNVIDMFLRHPTVGVATPPVVHISFPTLGHSWFVNKAKVAKLAADLGLKVQLDDHTPVAVYGTMFWFRPKALRPLFARKWKFSEFNAEPAPCRWRPRPCSGAHHLLCRAERGLYDAADHVRQTGGRELQLA